jgi:tRNA dimethylallyltransferase
MKEKRPKIVVISGPTASGKTSLAVELALRLGGEVVNADSMQVYRGMDIGTAKPTEDEKKGVPHHLLDVADPDEAFNAARYRSLALPVIRGIHDRGLPCFVVGGSGLYIRALLGGLFECPQPPEELRLALRQDWETLGPEVLHRRLERLDPRAAQNIHPNDRVRVLRALEVIELTGRPFSAAARVHDFKDEAFEALKICLHMGRENLYDRINLRSSLMVRHGLVDETRRLLKKGYGPELKPMQSIGYRHAVRVLQGDWDVPTMIERLQVDTRRYAKRQLTWFRGESGYAWRKPGDLEGICGEVSCFYERFS